MYINQPYDKNLGTELIEQISSNNYEQLTIMVAYAKLSGVNRILPTLKSFVENKGKIRCIIGIDQNNTSYEALNELMNISEKMYVFHSEDFSQTFHIKCYWLNSSDKLWYAIGSNNLTAGGLFSNYEMCSTNTLNDENALDAINKLEETFSKYVDSKECCIELNEDILCKLLENGYPIYSCKVRTSCSFNSSCTNLSQRSGLGASQRYSMPRRFIVNCFPCENTKCPCAR